MKKNYYFLVLLAIPFIALILGLSGGRDGQYSGSPGDNFTTCSNCHSGGSFDAVAEITSTIPASGFVYGETYQVTVSVTSTSSKHGFQLTTEDESDAKVGTYTAGTGNQIVNGGTHMTHTQTGNQQNSWTFDWTAPLSIEGDQITFYTAVNATNGNSSTSGDQVVTTSTTYDLSTVGISENETIPFSIYPNPTSEYISLNYDNSLLSNATITIIDYSGKIVLQTNSITERIDVKDLNTGIYIIQITSDTKTTQSRFIKE